MAVTFTVLVRRVIMNGAKQQKQASSFVPSKKPPSGRQTTRSQTRNQSSTSPDKKPQTSVKKSYSDSGLNKAFDKLSVKTSTSPTRASSSLSDYSKKSSAKNARSISTFSVSSLEDVGELIKQEKCRRIVVMAGAGISTPSGIPDFRTPGSGLYDNLQKYNVPEPTDIFDINYFWYDPQPFFCLARTLYPGLNFQPNYVHYFIRHLFDKGLLHRMYTQNIDGLERLAGIPPLKLIEAHGTFTTASCVSCRQHHDGTVIKEIIVKGEIPKCKIEGCHGVVKPDIVFFGENLPKRFYSFHDDIPNCDLLIVMGTSLEVEPFASIAREVNRGTPRILFNREVVGPFRKKWKRSNDIVCKGDIVKGIEQFVEMLGWNEELEKLISDENQKWKETYGKGNSNDSVQNNNPVKTENGERTSKHLEKVEPPKNKRGLHSLSTSSTGQAKESSNMTLLNGDSLLCANSVVRTKMPTFTLRENASFTPEKKDTKLTTRTDFKAIDPSQDLASAGFGLGKRTSLRTDSSARRLRQSADTKGAKFLMGETESSEDSTDSDCSSVNTGNVKL